MNTSQYSLLIDQTMLCEASRLLDGVPTGEDFHAYLESHVAEGFNHRSFLYDYRMGMDWWPPTNSERLFHLSTLLDAVALYDDICVLKAELPPDADTLKLRSLLVDDQIVKTIDTSSISNPISNEFREFLSSVQPGRSDLKSARNLLADEISTTVLHALQGVSAPEQQETTDRRRRIYRQSTIIQGLNGEYEGTLSHWWLEDERDELQANVIATLGGHLIDKIGYYGSGAIVSGVSHLRTFVYWRVSDHLQIPFFPSCRRLPQFEMLAKQLSPSAHQEIYKIIADAFKGTVEQAYEDCQPTVIPLPPITSIFLEKLKKEKDVGVCVAEIRSEFKGVRDALKKLQSDLRNSETILDRISAKKQLRGLIETLAKHYALQNDAILDEALAYAPSVLKPLSNPLNPEKYTAELVKKPIEWIKGWWTRRPFRVAYKLRDRLIRIPQYRDLARDSLSINISEEESKGFQDYYDQYLSLYGAKESSET